MLTLSSICPLYIFGVISQLSKGLRCHICLMNIHDECLEKAMEKGNGKGCTGRPDPRSGSSHFVREGVSNLKFALQN